MPHAHSQSIMKSTSCPACGRTSSRSSEQNRYYHGILLTILADHTGYTTDDLHEYLKQSFLPQPLIKILGQHIVRTVSTTQLDTKEFNEYIEKIRTFAREELDCYIPLPNEPPVPTSPF